MNTTVTVLGASPKADRYSNKAVLLLKDKQYKVIPVNPAHEEIEGIKAVRQLEDISTPVDTLTIYLGPKHILPLIPAIIELNPGRVILNPGTESTELMEALDKAQIPYLQACTLVMLNTNQF